MTLEVIRELQSHRAAQSIATVHVPALFSSDAGPWDCTSALWLPAD
jgi:hypothetical protein